MVEEELLGVDQRPQDVFVGALHIHFLFLEVSQQGG